MRISDRSSDVGSSDLAAWRQSPRDDWRGPDSRWNRTPAGGRHRPSPPAAAALPAADVDDRDGPRGARRDGRRDRRSWVHREEGDDQARVIQTANGLTRPAGGVCNRETGTEALQERAVKYAKNAAVAGYLQKKQKN